MNDQQQAREDMRRLAEIRKQLELSNDPDLLRAWALKWIDREAKQARKQFTGART